MIDNAGIYAMSFNTGNSVRIYIGSSFDLKRRRRGHLKSLKVGKHHNIRVQRCWDKYGSSFDWEILENCNRDMVREREQWWFDVFKDSKVLININPYANGGSPKGRIFSPEALENMSKSRLGIPESKEHRQAISDSLKGRILTPEWRAKISKAHLDIPGRPLSQEAREKISKSKLGIPRSEETRAKMSRTCKGRISGNKGKHHSQEARAKISKALSGVPRGPMSEECRQAISNSLLGVPFSEERKANVSKGLKRWWQERKEKLNQTAWEPLLQG